MIIQGYEVGTEVKWTDDATGAFRTGIVRARYYNPEVTEIDGEEIEITVLGNSPTYAVEDTEEELIVIDHTRVTMRHQNDHT
ncbi:MAG: hypothetical protein ACFE0Q_16240 [Anaerolineae bacterium]